MAAMTLLLLLRISSSSSCFFHINYESAFGEREIYLAYISISVLFFVDFAFRPSFFLFCNIIFAAICGYSGERGRIGCEMWCLISFYAAAADYDCDYHDDPDPDDDADENEREKGSVCDVLSLVLSLVSMGFASFGLASKRISKKFSDGES